jgi:hypothetical protein
MRKIEIAVIGVIFGAVPIIACFLAGWWISIPFIPEKWIPLLAFTGLFIGVGIDSIFLKEWIRTAYSMKPLVWMMMYLFYSVGMFGMFMGVPVFNVGLALPVGFFIGGWLAHLNADSTRVARTARYTALYTTGVLAFLCIASAGIALASDSTRSDLHGMFGFPITTAMLIGIIVGGGFFILVLQWWLVSRSITLVFRLFIEHAGPSTSYPSIGRNTDEKTK